MNRKGLFILLILFIIAEGVQSQGHVHFESRENTRVAVNKEYSYNFNARDSSGDVISYSVTKKPGWIKYRSSNYSISGKTNIPGQYRVQIMAIAKKDTAFQNFMLTVYNKQTTNILCLGNSITNGVDTFNSYRRDLWQMLHAANYNFDFIGSWSKHHMGTVVPIPDFDMDHEGHSGWTANDIFYPPSWDSTRGNIKTWLTEYTPGIVLIELGTNDVFQCRKPDDILKNFSDALNLLRKKNNRVKIFIAQIPPLGAQWSNKKLCGNDVPYSQAILNLNKAIATFAVSHSTDRSPVIAVDQFTGVDPSVDMFDDIHPNTKGEKIMAERWFVAISHYLKKIK